MSFRLLVPRTLHDALVAQALAEKPNECVGLLAGRVAAGVGRAEAIYPLVNALASPVEYESEPHSMFLACRDLTARGLDILAVYHSHPTSPPIPSKKDLARNYSEDTVTIIVSLTTAPPTVRAWWLTADAYREADWTVEE